MPIVYMFLCFRTRPWNGTGSGTSLLPTADVRSGKRKSDSSTCRSQYIRTKNMEYMFYIVLQEAHRIQGVSAVCLSLLTL